MRRSQCEESRGDGHANRDRDVFVPKARLDYAVSSIVTVGVSYSGQYGQRAMDNAFKGI